MAVHILHNTVITGSLEVGSSIRDTTDTDTGFDLPGGNRINMVCGNTTRASVTSSAFNVEVPAIVNDTLELNNGLVDINQGQGSPGQFLKSLGAGAGVIWDDVPETYSLTAGGDTGGPFNVTNSGQLFLTGGTGIKTTTTQPAAGSVDVDFSLEATGVTAGAYTSANITVDAQGRITTASSGGGGLSGSGTTNYIPKFTGSTAIGNSSFYESGDDLYIPNYIYHIGATDDFFGFPIGGRFSINVGNSEQIRVIDGGTTINNAFGTNGPATFGDTLKYSTPTGNSTTFNGEIVDFGGVAGAVTTGDLVVLRHSLGSPQWFQADYNSFLNATGMLGIYDGTNVLVRGFVQNSSFSFTTSGAPLYMGVTGGISTSAPTANGDYVRIIGYVADAANDRIYFCPDNTWVLI